MARQTWMGVLSGDNGTLLFTPQDVGTYTARLETRSDGLRYMKIDGPSFDVTKERTLVQEKPMKPKKIKASTEDLLVKLLAAIKATYPNDVPSAGLVLSELDRTDKPQYGSICRYHGNGKQVVHTAHGATLKDVLV